MYVCALVLKQFMLHTKSVNEQKKLKNDTAIAILCAITKLTSFSHVLYNEVFKLSPLFAKIVKLQEISFNGFERNWIGTEIFFFLHPLHTPTGTRIFLEQMNSSLAIRSTELHLLRLDELNAFGEITRKLRANDYQQRYGVYLFPFPALLVQCFSYQHINCKNYLAIHVNIAAVYAMP